MENFKQKRENFLQRISRTIKEDSARGKELVEIMKTPEIKYYDQQEGCFYDSEPLIKFNAEANIEKELGE